MVNHYFRSIGGLYAEIYLFFVPLGDGVFIFL